MSSIPASDIVAVTPSVISGGGSALVMNGLLLTNNTQIPIGPVLSFSSAGDISNYFGPSSTEYALASIYFLGFDNSNIKPGSILMAQYPTSAVAAWLRGGSVSSMTLSALQALSGTLSITVNGTAKTSSTISLAAIGIRALFGLRFDEAGPLLDELMGCVKAIPDPARPNVIRPLVADDIEEVATLIQIKSEVFELHTGFSPAAILSIWVLPTLAVAAGDLPTTETSPA